MNFFQKVKSFVKNKLPSKKVEPKSESSRPVNEEISEFVLLKLNEQIANPNSVPAGLTKKQWRRILGNMAFAWDQGFRGIEYASKRKRKIQKFRILLGFKLFVKYFKYIK